MEALEHEYGRHYLVELIGCNAETLKYVKDVKEVFGRAAVKSRATVLGDHYHQFDPEGVSGTIFIAESHFAIHTWPQDGYAGFDILTCGDMDAELAIEEMKNGFEASEAKVKMIQRGY